MATRKKATKKKASKGARAGKGGAAEKRSSGALTAPAGGDVQAFFAAVEEEDRRADCKALAKLIERATGLKPRLWGSIVGFGEYHYRYASGREGDCFLAGFAPRKQDLSIYLTGGCEAQGELLRKLGKHKAGRACLYVKRLADVDPKVLEELVRRSVASTQARYPG
jgi:hypothetical protein